METVVFIKGRLVDYIIIITGICVGVVISEFTIICLQDIRLIENNFH